MPVAQGQQPVRLVRQGQERVVIPPAVIVPGCEGFLKVYVPGINSMPLVKVRHVPVEYWVMHAPSA
jgi:hypothetical protein